MGGRGPRRARLRGRGDRDIVRHRTAVPTSRARSVAKGYGSLQPPARFELNPTVPASGSTAPGDPIPTPVNSSTPTAASAAASSTARAIAATTAAAPPSVGVGCRARPTTSRSPSSTIHRSSCRPDRPRHAFVEPTRVGAGRSIPSWHRAGRLGRLSRSCPLLDSSTRPNGAREPPTQTGTRATAGVTVRSIAVPGVKARSSRAACHKVQAEPGSTRPRSRRGPSASL